MQLEKIVSDLTADGFSELVRVSAVEFGKIRLENFDEFGDAVVESDVLSYAMLDVGGHVFYAVDGYGLFTREGFVDFLEVLGSVWDAVSW